MNDSSLPPDSARLARYLSGECTPEELRAVEQWLGEDPRNVEELGRLSAAWSRPRESAAADPGPDIERVWQQVRKRLEVPAAPEVRVLRPGRPKAPTFGMGERSRWPFAIRVAAAIMLVGGAWLAGGTLLRPPHRPAAVVSDYSVISTTRGQRLSIRLADGTLVALAPGTTLRTPATYGVRDRTVELDGEAAFTVTHDSTRPFSVRTRRAVARDLGTEFLVRAYAGDPVMDVVVAEGLVAVGRGADSAAVPLSSDSLVIARGERVRVAPDGRLALTKGVSLDRYFGWTRGELVFRRTPLREAIAQLERWYDFDIRLASPELGEQGLTATFSEREPASRVLQVISTVLRLEAVPTGAGSYTLRPKR